MKKNIAVENYEIISQLPNIEERANMLATEDFGTYVKSISNFFTSKLGAVSEIFSSNKKRTKILDKSYSEFIIDMKKEGKHIPKIIKNKTYSDVKFIKVPVMLGTVKDLPVTIKQLESVMPIISDKLVTSLDNLDTFVAKVLGDKEFRKATRPFPPLEERKELKQLDDVISTLIDRNSMNDVKPIGDLLPNLSSLSDVHEGIIVIARGSSLKDMQAIEKQIKTISARVKELEDFLTVNNDTEISKAVVNELGSKLEVNAKLITSALSVLHILNQTAMTIKHIIERLK